MKDSLSWKQNNKLIEEFKSYYKIIGTRMNEIKQMMIDVDTIGIFLVILFHYALFYLHSNL